MRSLFAVVIYLVRHGQSTTNAQGLLVGRSDPPLTDHGRDQARALQAWMKDVQEVWSSPLQRAYETATLAAPGRPVLVREALIEVDYGHLDGTALSDVSAEQWREFEGEHHRALGGGESLLEVDQRVHALLDDVLRESDSWLFAPDRHLLMVSHVSPSKSALAWAMGVAGSVAWRLRVDNGSLSVLGARRDGPALIRTNVVPA